MGFLSKDTWIGIVVLAAASLFWLEASKIRTSALDDPVGAAGLPKALAVALGVLALLLIARSVIGELLNRRARIPKEKAKSDLFSREALTPHLRAIAMLAIGVGYLLLIGTLGYTLTVMLLIFTVSLFIGAPISVRTVLVATIGAVAFYFLFVRFLGIPLPPGTFLPALFGDIF